MAWIMAQKRPHLPRRAAVFVGWAGRALYIATQPQPMYNFMVAVAHTYFAWDGQWMVHNSGCRILMSLGNYDPTVDLLAFLDNDNTLFGLLW